MYIGDRTAVADLFGKLASMAMADMLKGACHPLETRLKHILRELHDRWTDQADIPQWRTDQCTSPDAWNVQLISQDDDKLHWYCRIADCTKGVVSIDVKSHQTDT